MRQAGSALWKSALIALMRRRESRSVGLYTVCAILVVLYALSVLYGIGAEAPPDGLRLSHFLIPAVWLSFPVAVALVQVWRQTLLGWLLLLAGFGVVAGGLCYFMVSERLLDPWPLTLPATAIVICVSVIFMRPTT